MERTTQGTDSTGNTAVQITQSRGADASGEGRGVEFVLCIKNQRYVHHTLMQLVGLFATQQVQEVGADGIVIGFRIDFHTVVAEAIPVTDDAREGGQQTVGGIFLLAEIGFRFQVAQHGAAGAHHVHGVSILGDLLKDGFQGVR